MVSTKKIKKIGKISLILILFLLWSFGMLIVGMLLYVNINKDSFSTKNGMADTAAYVNQIRQSYHLTLLIENPILDKVAEIKACDMQKRGYFEHADPNGQMPWHLFTENGYNYSYAGENIAEGSVGSNDTMQNLLNSPEHRDNILFPHYTEIGIANCGYMYVQEFAQPK